MIKIKLVVQVMEILDIQLVLKATMLGDKFLVTNHPLILFEYLLTNMLFITSTWDEL
jgi:hypothetical protein